MFDTAVLRSGYTIQDSVSFAKRILEMMYSNMDIDPNTPVSINFLFIFHNNVGFLVNIEKKLCPFHTLEIASPSKMFGKNRLELGKFG